MRNSVASNDYSPERTFNQQSDTSPHLNQDLPVSGRPQLDSNADKKSKDRHETIHLRSSAVSINSQNDYTPQPQFDMLTSAGVDKGSSLISLLEFKDKDLQELVKVKDMQERIYKQNFHTT